MTSGACPEPVEWAQDDSLTLSQLFGQRAAASGADFKAFAANRQKLQIWFLAARNFNVRMAHVVSADRGFSAQAAGSTHIEYLGKIGYTRY